MEHILGLDGGGTKTDAVVVNRLGKVLMRKRTAGLDPTAGPGWEATLTDIAAGLGPVAAAVLGMPYHDEIAAISARQTALAVGLFGAGSTVLNDVAVAFEGALAGADGMLVLAGTGSMAWARSPLGTHRVGGWGDVFGDEGSAYWIGREALARISRELDGRNAATGFADAMLARMGITATALIGWTYGLDHPRVRVAGLAPMVSDLAQNGSATAAELMTEAARHLAELGQTAAQQCGAPPGWSFAGGVMTDPTVMAVLTQTIGCAPTPPILPPVGGAVLAAAKTAGWDTGPDFIATLQADLTK
jgi:glucosamine kinase